MKQKSWWLLSVALVMGLAHCSKPLLFDTVQNMKPLVKFVEADQAQVVSAAKQALESNGYRVQNETANQLETGWQPTTADSHYVAYFERQDRGTVGAYHKLVLNFSSEGGKTRVEIASIAKSIVSNLQSTQIEENKVLKRIQDFTRPANVQVTNVGIRQ